MNELHLVNKLLTMGKTLQPELYDVIIVGAGLSGIGTAYWLQKKCPKKSFLIFEGRDRIGGTWDLFRYPGVRSDSDMFTFGFRFKPWKNPQPLSDGESILNYLQETVDENDLQQKICFGHQVTEAHWNSNDACWKIHVSTGNETRIIYTRFLYMCSGYYSYEQPHRPTFEGEKEFPGTIVLPQFWPRNLNYSGKKVVIIGSGATAVTLVPAMAKTAEHVTMVQRSPTYIMSLPNKDKFYQRIRSVLPDTVAYRFTRWKNLLLSIFLYTISRTFPQYVKKLIVRGAKQQLPTGYDVDKHFSPHYNPWDQRLCVVPNGDLFEAIRNNKASVVTDTIERFTPEGILLKSGTEIKADIIVLATGLTIRLLGGMQVTIDGKKTDTSQAMIYKGMLISDVPNAAIAFGYTNASWTLKTDLTANYVCRLLNYMDRFGFDVVIPKREKQVEEKPFLDFNAGYIQRAAHILPKQGSRRPWKVYQNYLKDMLTTRYSRIADKVLHFEKKTTVA